MPFPSPMPRGDTEIRAGSPLAHVRSRAPQPLTQGPCRLDPRAQPRAEVETAGRTVREPREDTRELRARKGPFAGPDRRPPGACGPGTGRRPQARRSKSL